MTRLVVMLLVWAASVTAVWAQLTTSAPAVARAETKPVWASLTVAQQTALAPLRQQWPAIDADRKAKWLVVAQRFPAMPAEDQRRLQARMAEWAAMTPAERGRARQSFQELRNLPAPDRQAHWQAYRALSDDERRELAQRAKQAAKPTEPAASAPVKPRVAVNQSPVTVKPITPTIVQAKPGATTTLVTKAPAPPTHHQPGLPKITASKGFVNPSTLLPARGPQGAATHTSSASAPADEPRQQ